MVSLPRSYDEAVKVLAESHAKSDSGTVRVISYPDPNENRVRLVVVSDHNLPAEGEQVVAYPFTRAKDFPFLSEVALLSLDDWQRVTQGTLKLPAGWATTGAHEVWSRN